MSSGFFRFYAHMGVLHALEENDCLRVKSCSGSSAGALVTGFLASGMKPSEMPEKVFGIKRHDMWDMGIGLGLLKGQLFQEILEKNMNVKTFEQCIIPLGVTAYDVLGMKTNCITSGDIATAIRASCTFPGLFQPVLIDNRLHIDGGVWDDGGLMALPSVPPSNLIVNVVCGRGRIGSSVLPEKFKDARLLTLVLDNIPAVSPFNMETDGPKAYSIARAATFRMLQNGHLEQLSHNHWCAYIDGSLVELSVPLVPLPSRLPKAREDLSLDSDDNPPNPMLSRRPSFQFHEKARLSGGGNSGEIKVVDRGGIVDSGWNGGIADALDITSIVSRNSIDKDTIYMNQISNDTYDNHKNKHNSSQLVMSTSLLNNIDDNLDAILHDSCDIQIDMDVDIHEISIPNSSSSSELSKNISTNSSSTHNNDENINEIYTSLQDTVGSQADMDVDINEIVSDLLSNTKKRNLIQNSKGEYEGEEDSQEMKKLKPYPKIKKNDNHEDNRKYSNRSQSLTKILKRERVPSFKLRD